MRRPDLSTLFFLDLSTMAVADQREAPHSVLLFPFLRKGFSSPRRFALLPFALSVERFAPVPVGVLDSNRVLPSQCRTDASFPEGRSAATSQSPELGDGGPSPSLLSCCFPSGFAGLAIPQGLV